MRGGRDWFRRGVWVSVAWFLFLVPAVAGSAGLLHTRIEVSARGLDFRGELLHRTIPFSELQLQAARIVDLDRELGLRPHWKLCGAGLPSHHSGWFRLRDREKALVALDRSRRAVYIPTSRGFAILVSPDDPSAFLDALRRPTDAGRVFEVSIRASH